MSEIKNIMNYLGRGMLEGQVKGTHLSLILFYLQRTKNENMKSTLSKLALICGMQKRYIRENYIEGLQEFGIIQLKSSGHEVVWNWIGEKAFDSKTPIIETLAPKEHDETLTDMANRLLKEKEEKEKKKKKKKIKEKEKND